MPQPRHFTQEKFQRMHYVKKMIIQISDELLTSLDENGTKWNNTVTNKNQHWRKRPQKKHITYKKQLKAKSNKKKNRTRSRSKRSYSSRTYSSKSQRNKNDQSSYSDSPSHSQTSTKSKYSTRQNT